MSSTEHQATSMFLSFILFNIFPGTFRVKSEPSPRFLRQMGMPFWAYPPKLGSK